MKLLILFLCGLSPLLAQPLKVQLKPTGPGYALLLDGKPYLVRGFVGASQFERARQAGANSVRTNATLAWLDQAHANGFTALTNLPIPGERDGMDWNDEARKATLKTTLLATIEQFKEHPAVLSWALGNELDWIPPGKPYNPKLWDFLNDVAGAIHRIDPNHPVMTVIGTSTLPQKLNELARQCPNLDWLGINAYADLGLAMSQVRSHWKRPYMITEWGPNGHWEVKKTTWKAPLEESSTEKARTYRTHYLTDIRADSLFCLGSYVFYWHHKQEITHTWYGLFDEAGKATEAVETMGELWTGKPTRRPTPQIDTCFFEGMPNPRNTRFNAGQPVRVNLQVRRLAGGQPTSLSWEIRPEVNYAAYAGQGEQAAQVVNEQKYTDTPGQLNLSAPKKPGAYRLFLTVAGKNGQIATVNLPFMVQ